MNAIVFKSDGTPPENQRGLHKTARRCGILTTVARRRFDSALPLQAKAEGETYPRYPRNGRSRPAKIARRSLGPLTIPPDSL